MIKSDITMEDIINEGFEIIEEVYFAEIESPVQLKNIKDLKLSRLDYRTCDLNLEKKEVYLNNAETYFSVYLNGKNVLLTEPLETMKEYFRDYFTNKKIPRP